MASVSGDRCAQREARLKRVVEEVPLVRLPLPLLLLPLLLKQIKDFAHMLRRLTLYEVGATWLASAALPVLVFSLAARWPVGVDEAELSVGLWVEVLVEVLVEASRPAQVQFPARCLEEPIRGLAPLAVTFDSDVMLASPPVAPAASVLGLVPVPVEELILPEALALNVLQGPNPNPIRNQI